MSILTQNQSQINTQLRPGLWIASAGALVGFGPLLAVNGISHCFTCGTDDCQHVKALDKSWLAGLDSVEDSCCMRCQWNDHCGNCSCCRESSTIPFDGRPCGCDESSEEARLGLPVEW